MTVAKTIAAILLGLAACLVAFVYAVGSGNMLFTGVMSLVAGGGTAFAALKAPSGRQGWGRGFLGLAATFLIMPTLLASALGQQFEDHTVQSLLDDETAMGEALVSSMLVGVGMLSGVFFGAPALIPGLILNRAPRPVRDTLQDRAGG
jgi:hypothetical protein